MQQLGVLAHSVPRTTLQFRAKQQQSVDLVQGLLSSETQLHSCDLVPIVEQLLIFCLTIFGKLYSGRRTAVLRTVPKSEDAYGEGQH